MLGTLHNSVPVTPYVYGRFIHQPPRAANKQRKVRNMKKMLQRLRDIMKHIQLAREQRRLLIEKLDNLTDYGFLDRALGR